MIAIAAQMNCAGARPVYSLVPSHPIAQDGVSQCLMAGSSRILQAGEHIFHEGDSASHIYKIEQGNLCIYHLMPDGRRQIYSFAYPGDLIGLGVVEEHVNSAETLNLVRLRSFPRAKLYQAARNDVQLGLRLFELVSHDLMAAQRMFLILSKRSASERVAAFLVDLSKRLQHNGGAPRQLLLPMTRGDIGDLLGLTIETVSRTISKFRRCGLIEVVHCTVITIMNLDALTELADGEIG